MVKRVKNDDVVVRFFYYLTVPLRYRHLRSLPNILYDLCLLIHLKTHISYAGLCCNNVNYCYVFHVFQGRFRSFLYRVGSVGRNGQKSARCPWVSYDRRRFRWMHSHIG